MTHSMSCSESTVLKESADDGHSTVKMRYKKFLRAKRYSSQIMKQGEDSARIYAWLRVSPEIKSAQCNLL